MKIEDIMGFENNTPIEGSYIISELSLRPFKEKEGSYLSFILQDKTGRMFGKIWENGEEIKEQLDDATVINIKGRSNLFNGRNTIIVEWFEKTKDYNLEDFQICSPKDSIKMMKEFLNLMETIQDKDLKILWEKGFNNKDILERFRTCPGGKGNVHHAYLYGLLEHTLSVMKICDAFCKLYPIINRDILLFGAFLHDFGKMDAYDWTVTVKITDQGRLHGHMALGYNSFVSILTKLIEKGEIAKNRGKEIKKLLGHLIVSHHGSFEHETIRLPQTLEASVLAKADDIDSEITYVSNHNKNLVDNWSSFDNLRSRMYYFSPNFSKRLDIDIQPDFIQPEQKIKRKKKKSESKLFDYNEDE